MEGKESILALVLEAARSNGGYLTIEGAVKSCGQTLNQLVDGEENASKRIKETFKKSKRNDSCSSNASSGSSSSSSTTMNAERREAVERKLKALIRSSEKFKLNGNVLFVNGWSNPKCRSQLSHLKEIRRNSLPGLLANSEVVSEIRQTPESKPEKQDDTMGRTSEAQFRAVQSVSDFKRMAAKHPCHFGVEGDGVRSTQNPSSQTKNVQLTTVRQQQQQQRQQQSVGCGCGGSAALTMLRSHSFERCDDICEHLLERVPPSFLATPCSLTGCSSLASWPDLESIAKKYKNSERLVAIVKNFESDVQLAVDRLVKQMRSELDSMLVELHRPADKNIGEGVVYCVEKKWGIVDLGSHDHVFFDMSIMLGSITDLRNHFRVGEVLGFEAVRAQKSSRANWRAIRIWKVGGPAPGDGREGARATFDDASTSSASSSTIGSTKFKFHDKLLGRMFECGGGGSSKGNSPDSSPTPAEGRWRKKNASNPFSRTAHQLGVQNPFSTDACQKAAARDHKSGLTPSSSSSSSSSIAWESLASKSKTPKEEIRLFPTKMLTPPEVKKTSNPGHPAVKPWPLQKIPEPSTRGSNALQIAGQASALRDSGNESGNSSPDTLLRSEKRFDCRQQQQRETNHPLPSHPSPATQ